MVRKVIAVVCCLAALAALPLAASAATVYDGTISTTYITIFRDIVGKIGLNDEYVFYRSGQYEYTMIAGDLSWDGSIFSADSATSYVLTTTSTYNSNYVYSVGSVSSWSLSPGSTLVYSSLGSFPDLVDNSVTYSFASVMLIFICICLFLVRSLFIAPGTIRRR